MFSPVHFPTNLKLLSNRLYNRRHDRHRVNSPSNLLHRRGLTDSSPGKCRISYGDNEFVTKGTRKIGDPELTNT